MIVTALPAVPEHGENALIVGEQPPGFALVKTDGLVVDPTTLVIRIVPLAPSGTVAQISVALTILNADTGVPPISMLDSPGSSKFVPVMTITQSAGPLVGEKDVILGPGIGENDAIGGTVDAGA
jgi:hypothetical protein